MPPVTPGGRVTYRSVLANREFRALLAAQGLSTLGDQLARIAIAVLVFNRTGSAFAASATYAVASAAYLVGGPILSAVSDRKPRASVMVVCDLMRAPLLLLLCISGLPLWIFFVVLAVVGLFAPPFDSARSALQPDLLEGESYVMGNALMNLVLQAGQVIGFVAGGALVTLVSVRGALALDAATFLLSAGLIGRLIRRRPAALQAQAPASLLADTLSGFRMVMSNARMRRALGLALLGSAAIIAPEGLAVPVSRQLGGGDIAAGVLTASVPAGFLVASAVILRIPTERRDALMQPLVLLSCIPLVFTPLIDSIPAVTALWFLAGMGGCVNLIASSAYVQACPREYRGRAYGVATTSMNVVQGSFLLAAGAIAGLLTPTESITVLAGAMLVVLGLQASFRRARPQGIDDLVRSNLG